MFKHPESLRNDPPPSTFIQWKGTDVCVDIYCECGHHHHYDGDFMYAIKCLNCGRRYAVGTRVELAPIPPEISDADCGCMVELKDDDESWTYFPKPETKS